VKKISVLHLVEDLKIGGIEKVIFDLATNLNRNLYTVDVWCIARGGEIAEKLVRAGVRVRILGIPSYYNLFNIIRIARFIRMHKPDILHGHTYFSNTICRISGRLACVPVIIAHVHNTYCNYSYRNLLVERILSFFTNKIICCSNAVRNFVLKCEKISSQKAVVIHNGIDQKKFHKEFEISNLREHLKISSNTMVIITVASLTEKKGHRFFLEALKKIKLGYADIKWLIVGDGPIRKKLEELTQEFNLKDTVIFTGLRNDVSELLNNSDIFVLPSLKEGLPLAVIEAMSTGLPVVATSVGGVTEIIEDEKTGLLIPPGNPDAISSAVMILLKDIKKREYIGRHGRKSVIENFASDKMVAKVEQLYSDCIIEKDTNKSYRIPG
jgi:glycosyltransferase involved in cell wall biosynthesis